ncbi:hypothetical protein SynA15127_02177 [Synechococcus sp. A15-127]|nr:hypothetical protein SynA15127_02177 [Synechococcus sp. A15-127]
MAEGPDPTSGRLSANVREGINSEIPATAAAAIALKRFI